MLNDVDIDLALLAISGLQLLFIVGLLFGFLRLKSKLNEEGLNQNQLIEQFQQLREVQLERIAQLTLQTEQQSQSLKDVLQKTLNQFHTDLNEKHQRLSHDIKENLTEGRLQQQRSLSDFRETVLDSLKGIHEQSQKSTYELRDKLIQELRETIKDIRDELTKTLTLNSDNMVKSMTSLTESTDTKLKEISGQVEKRLSEGFEKTTQTFHDVLKRLALIDDAQKKITELSTNVVSLQAILSDKRSRGAFGEVQLNALIRNVLPENHFSIQHKLSNDKIADCILFLPEPTGNVVIDSKFPLESFQKLTDFESGDLERQSASRQFKQDIKKHINDIKSKYIIPGETASGAMMFIPAEAVFAEIHGHYPDLVEYAYKEKVWMVSPTTMMAILTTASAVIKDEATRKQVHIIQEHLGHLSKDFGRFRDRMDKLATDIGKVGKDVQLVQTSAQKITSRFDKIENVELLEEPAITPVLKE